MELSAFGSTAFEFMDVHGRKVTVPACTDGHEFSGKAVKHLAGVGAAVYIRLLMKIPRRLNFISDDSDFESSFRSAKHLCPTNSDSMTCLHLIDLRLQSPQWTTTIRVYHCQLHVLLVPSGGSFASSATAHNNTQELAR